MKRASASKAPEGFGSARSHCSETFEHSTPGAIALEALACLRKPVRLGHRESRPDLDKVASEKL